MDLEQYTLEDIEDFMQTEEYEQLDELSKQTLGRYVLRNHEKSASLAREKADNDDAQSKAMSIDYGSNREASKHMKPVRDALHDAGKKIQHKTYQRQMGMYRAVKKLTKEGTEPCLALIQAIEESKASDITAIFDKIMAQKLSEAIEDKKVEIAESIFVSQEDQELMEDYEQLDELSKQTLATYIGRASQEVKHAGRSAGLHSSLFHMNGNDNDKKFRDDSLKHANKRIIGINKAARKLTKEDLDAMSLEELDDLIENADQLDEVSGKLLGPYIQKARADRQKKYDNEKELDRHPKVKEILDKKRELYDRREYTKSGDNKHQKTINKLRAKEPEVKKKLDPNYPKSGIQGANKRGRGIEAAIKKLTQGKLSD